MPINVIEFSEIFSVADTLYKEIVSVLPRTDNGHTVLFLYGKEDPFEESKASKACMSYSQGYERAWSHLDWYKKIGQKYDALMHQGFVTAYDGKIQGLCLPGGFAVDNGRRRVFAAHGLGWQADEFLSVSVMKRLGCITNSEVKHLLQLSKNSYDRMF